MPGLVAASSRQRGRENQNAVQTRSRKVDSRNRLPSYKVLNRDYQTDQSASSEASQLLEECRGRPKPRGRGAESG